MKENKHKYNGKLCQLKKKKERNNTVVRRFSGINWFSGVNSSAGNGHGILQD